MTWLLFAFLTAVSESAKDLSAKKSLITTNRYVVGWGLLFFGAVTVLPFFLFVEIPVLGEYFFETLIIHATLLGVSMYVYIEALDAGDVSLSIPMIMFSPLFMLITSPIIIGEFPSSLGLVGVMLIVSGSYMLQLSENKHGFFEPFRALFRERGTRLMLLVAFIWSITANIDRIGINNASPLFWMPSLITTMAIVTYPLFLRKHPGLLRETIRSWRAVIVPGVAQGVMSICHVMAISFGLVVYVIAIKRTSAMMTVFFSSRLLGEEHITERLLGTVIMLSGAICIAVAG